MNMMERNESDMDFVKLMAIVGIAGFVSGAIFFGSIFYLVMKVFNS